MWKCRGSEPYRDKGRKVKCPNAYVRSWFDGDGPEVCGKCGSGILREDRWLPNDSTKDRYTLVRLVAWYCEEQSDTGGLQPWAFPDGTPAVELSFQLPLPEEWKSTYGDQYVLCGHMDSIVRFGGEGRQEPPLGAELFISDNKTTKSFLGAGYGKRTELGKKIPAAVYREEPSRLKIGKHFGETVISAPGRIVKSRPSRVTAA